MLTALGNGDDDNRLKSHEESYATHVGNYECPYSYSGIVTTATGVGLSTSAAASPQTQASAPRSTATKSASMDLPDAGLSLKSKEGLGIGTSMGGTVVVIIVVLFWWQRRRQLALVALRREAVGKDAGRRHSTRMSWSQSKDELDANEQARNEMGALDMKRELQAKFLPELPVEERRQALKESWEEQKVTKSLAGMLNFIAIKWIHSHQPSCSKSIERDIFL